MTARPPPFSALRAVEAASRHRSFTWAARELNITHSAVSQSIRRLEADLGTPLFQRRGGAMEPSEAALRLAGTYSEAAQSLERTLREVTGGSQTGVLSVAMPAGLGRLWFGGKLSRLAESMPDLKVDIRTVGAEGQASGSDVAIVFAPAEGREADAVSPEVQLFPVCSPSMLKDRDLSTPALVVRAPLIATGDGGWDQWSSRFTVPAGSPAFTFDDPAMALEAAAQGAGIMLTDVFAAEALLESGKLVALPLEAPTGRHMLLDSRSPAGKADLVSRFSLWLRLEVGRTLALHAARRNPVARSK